MSVFKLNEDQVYHKLLDFGFFPENISKIFSSEKFGRWVRLNGINQYKGRAFSNVTFRITRNNNAPRILHIPHPIAYYRLCTEIKKNWQEISKSIGEVDDYSERSMIIPKPNNLNHRLVSMLSYDRNKDEKFLVLDKSYEAKYFVHADIANCYPSIYSHSVSWALVGKKEAKLNITDKTKWYNKLDEAVRAVQRNETVGIPIGPDTSSVISELILSQIDKKLTNYNYFRFIDDYKCYCSSKEEVDSFIRDLSKVLEYFHLRLNPKKTEIIELPKPIEENWVRELKAFSNRFLDNDILSIGDLNTLSEFMDLAIHISRNNPSESSLKYCAKILSKKKFLGNDIYTFFIMYLSRMCFIQPYFIDIFDIVLENNPPTKKNLELIAREINSIMKEHLVYSRSDVALWGVHLSIKYGLKIKSFEKYSQYLMDERDCLPTLLCYRYAKLNGLDTKKYFALVKDLVAERLEEDWWIYIYSLYRDSNRKAVFRQIAYKDFYENMRKGKVEF